MWIPGGGLRRAALGSFLLLVSGTPAAAQLGISGGANLYGSDEFCLNSEAAVTYFEASLSGDLFGVSASGSNSDVPWLPPPGSGGADVVVPAALLVAGAQQEEAFLSQGEAFQASLDVYVLDAVRRIAGGERNEGIGRIDRIVRPFVSAGVILVTDGDASPAGGGRQLPTYGLQGFTAPTISYGARAFLPSRESRIGLLLQYRRTHAFVGDAEYATPDGETIRVGDETLDWGTFSVGVSLNVGG